MKMSKFLNALVDLVTVVEGPPDIRVGMFLRMLFVWLVVVRSFVLARVDVTIFISF